MDAALTWYQGSVLASAVGNSPTITAMLSALHALGFTFIMGGALFANLGKLGVLFPSRPVQEVAGPGSRLIALGLVLSLPTGLLLFGPRALNTAHNPTFQLMKRTSIPLAVKRLSTFSTTNCACSNQSTQHCSTWLRELLAGPTLLI